MVERETELQMVRRHVRDGLVHVERQREIVADLRGRGEATELALQLLRAFEEALRQHRLHLTRIEEQEEGAGRNG